MTFTLAGNYCEFYFLPELKITHILLTEVDPCVCC
jgi:hypothetical protein